MESALRNQTFKADAGKLRPSLVFEGMPRAIAMICAVATYGAQKYESHSWKNVDPDRYVDAKFRHMIEDLLGFDSDDPESGLMHHAHEIINQMYLLEFKLMDLKENQFRKLLKFKQPPQEHKNA